MAEDIEKRMQSVEAGFHIVANQVVGRIEEAHRDIRELGRESREHGRELRELRRDMTASFGQVSLELARIETNMATKEDIAALNTRMDALTDYLRDKFEQVISLLTRREE